MHGIEFVKYVDNLVDSRRCREHRAVRGGNSKGFHLNILQLVPDEVTGKCSTVMDLLS